MILYFTGTGNSEYVAKKLASALGDETLSLFERIREGDRSPLESEKPWVVVTPTYAWQIPHIVRDHLRRTLLRGNQNIYFVMTCGDGNGNAGKYAEELCEEKRLTFCGCAKVIMPENYLAMFSVPSREESVKIVEAAEPTIAALAECIRDGKPFPAVKVSTMDKMLSGAVNPGFYKMALHAKDFTVSDACVGCGTCVKACPTKAITLQDGHPVWEDNCTHCMACLTLCPKEAIEYGKKTAGKWRYRCPVKAE